MRKIVGAALANPELEWLRPHRTYTVGQPTQVSVRVTADGAPTTGTVHLIVDGVEIAEPATRRPVLSGVRRAGRCRGGEGAAGAAGPVSVRTRYLGDEYYGRRRTPYQYFTVR